ncbi:(SSU ribosomal protein S18P)-alanine acetyltransferase [Archaeoglobus sulfaticallidus PM70-1]|uniref:(SSU ribosomal protein S18P)-alanine acetyltransferase n=1 Tax=Archaeoglobus sulfaticallidus PM70-1 TaxID=387631 RepID=N0BI33_9EURY|nr:(SSU ribosomal protein S18P)-alanine acetyltransferase [Archaeoglobus sulfaticallidus PM70-1]
MIRSYTSRDVKDMLEIEKEAFQPANPSYDLFVYISHSDDLLVADIGGRVVGYIAVMDMDSSAKIISFAVKREFRGMGIGTILLDKALVRCRERGKKSVYLEVRVSNERAQKLYKKKGFKIIDVIPSYYRDGEDAYLMLCNTTDDL